MLTTVYEKFTDVVTKNELNGSKFFNPEHEGLKGKQIAPDRYNVYKNSEFGKTSQNHSFTSEASFEQVLLFILKSGYFSTDEKTNLLQTHVLYHHLNNMLDWSKKINFLSIRNPIKITQTNQKLILIEENCF